MVRKKDKGIENLYDVYKHYNGEVTFDIEYIPAGMDADFSFRIESELRNVSFEDASICVFDVEDKPQFFDLYFILDSGERMIYEHFMFETFESNLNKRLAEIITEKDILEKATKQCKLFYGILNPIFLLNILNDKECVQILLDTGAVYVDLDFFGLEINIINASDSSNGD